MSLYDFRTAIDVNNVSPPFYALIMAAMLKADDVNLLKLKVMWPHIWEELEKRYHARGGQLPGDEHEGEITLVPMEPL